MAELLDDCHESMSMFEKTDPTDMVMGGDSLDVCDDYDCMSREVAMHRGLSMKQDMDDVCDLPVHMYVAGQRLVLLVGNENVGVPI